MDFFVWLPEAKEFTETINGSGFHEGFLSNTMDGKYAGLLIIFLIVLLLAAENFT